MHCFHATQQVIWITLRRVLNMRSWLKMWPQYASLCFAMLPYARAVTPLQDLITISFLYPMLLCFVWTASRQWPPGALGSRETIKETMETDGCSSFIGVLLVGLLGNLVTSDANRQRTPQRFPILYFAAWTLWISPELQAFPARLEILEAKNIKFLFKDDHIPPRWI